MYSEEQKQKIYKNWIKNGRPWFHIDPKKEPTFAEKQIIIEIQKREKSQSQSQIRSRPKNEVKAFHRLLNNAFDY